MNVFRDSFSTSFFFLLLPSKPRVEYKSKPPLTQLLLQVEKNNDVFACGGGNRWRVKITGLSANATIFKSIETHIAERKSAPLPIFKCYVQFCNRLHAKKFLIVIDETNNGKTTQLPQYAAPSSSNGLVVCTQPRAITTRTLARRMAYEI
jgi:hypothetical protein